VPALLEALPAAPGVGQILGPQGRNLVIGRPANLRTWAANHLGRGKPSKKGGRPPIDLRPVTAEVAFGVTTSGFAQRLLYERLMARYVPLAKRRDLKPPAWLRLDPTERFPRVTVENAPGEGAHFGPFRDRRVAGRAALALQKAFPLRPCDYTFEPHPELPLGIGCLYAQVRSCAAPCLVRVTEDEYRGLAAAAAAVLADPDGRSAEVAAWLPGWVAASDRRGLVVERGRDGLELFPVVRGAVREEHAVLGLSDVDEAVSRLWFEAPEAADDTPWLVSWLHTPRRTGAFWVLGPDADAAGLAGRLRTLGGA
jgi:excinuclease ABC subunit C